MSRPLITGLILILGFQASTVQAQAPPVAESRRYKVAFWYEIDRPFSTVQYRAYDLAKKEYNEAAVNAWRRTITEKHPRFRTTLRELTTAGEPGATEAERLTNAVEREKRRWVELNTRPSQPLPSLVGSPLPLRTKGKGDGRAKFDRPVIGSPGPVGNLPTSPFPYPYRLGPR